MASALLRGAAGGYLTGPRSRHFVGMSQAVWQFSGPASLAFGADLEDVSGDSLVSALKGGGGGVLHGSPFAEFCGDVSNGLAIFWPSVSRFRSRFGGCLKRFAGFSTLRGAAGGYFTGPFSRHFVGMSQAVWPFSGPTSLAFGAHEQEGDEEEEEEAEEAEEAGFSFLILHEEEEEEEEEEDE